MRRYEAMMGVGFLGVFSGLANRFSLGGGISFSWNWGSMVGINMTLQVISGLLLSMVYIAGSFDSVCYMMEEMFSMEGLRYFHANYCTFVFFALWIHLGKGIWFGSFVKDTVWKSGSVLFIITMLAAFLGYVIVWGQMSFWGATVITGLLTVLPNSEYMLWMLWGGMFCGLRTVNRFLTLHIVVPLLIMGLIILHLMLLHEMVSQLPSGVMSWNGLFNNVFLKDCITLINWMLFVYVMMLGLPNYFMDAENWENLNAMVTPEHIKPEWYFLFAYSILRCVPDKTSGVIFFVLSILVVPLASFLGMSSYLGPVFLLTWLGSLDILDHFVYFAQWVSYWYFM